MVLHQIWVVLCLLLLECLHLPSAVAITFSAPQVVAASPKTNGSSAACYFFGLDTDDGRRLVVGAAGASIPVGSLNGRTPWTDQAGASEQALAETYPFPSECDGCSSMETLGVLQGLAADKAGTVLNASGGFKLSVAGGKLVTTPVGTVRRFQGLPRPLERDAVFTPGGMRWSGTASVRLRNGTLLQTGIVTFANQPERTDGTRRGPNATSVVLFASNDGIVWDYVATIADAKDYPESWEGANEMGMATLDDGTLVAVMRMDGGDSDGEKWAPHHDLKRDFDHFLPYYMSKSTDAGSTWSKLVPLPAGCARPRLLAVNGTGTLLLSGGRWHAAKPATSDVIVWASTDSGRTWAEYSLSYQHNRQVAPRNASLIASPAVNDTKWPTGGANRITSAYTSLVRVGPTQVLVVYNLHTALGGFPLNDPRASSTFAMIMSLQ